jgi:hypothetical protein
MRILLTPFMLLAALPLHIGVLAAPIPHLKLVDGYGGFRSATIAGAVLYALGIYHGKLKERHLWSIDPQYMAGKAARMTGTLSFHKQGEEYLPGVNPDGVTYFYELRKIRKKLFSQGQGDEGLKQVLIKLKEADMKNDDGPIREAAGGNWYNGRRIRGIGKYLVSVLGIV